ncbi:MAG TPA: DUF2279 domain-containing protein [Bacteroidota bacterium]|nr:DUF2279 domain-containing protein [Bacteroidota bacterium]
MPHGYRWILLWTGLCLGGLSFGQTKEINTAGSYPTDLIADSTASSSAGVNSARLAIVCAGTGALIVGAHLQNYDSWWKGARGPFHLSVDDAYPLGADKCGHILFSYYAADAIGRSFAWSGLGAEHALMYGGLTAFAFQTYVEIEDGFHPDIGFSIGDLAADAFGAVLPILQDRSPFLNAISPKWSANPSSRYLRHEYRTIIDDYESQYYWLSFNLRALLGDSTATFIPPFLNIAIGYGVTKLDLKGEGDREIYLALDLDVNRLPGNGGFLSAIKHVLNYIHVPAPAIRLTPGVITYGLRF